MRYNKEYHSTANTEDKIKIENKIEISIESLNCPYELPIWIALAMGSMGFALESFCYFGTTKALKYHFLKVQKGIQKL